MSGDLLKVPSLEVPCYSLPEHQQGWTGMALGTQCFPGVTGVTATEPTAGLGSH